MQKFIARFGSMIQGVICGADRLALRGMLRAIPYSFGTMASVDDSARLQGRPVRPLHPFSPEDGALLEIVSRKLRLLRAHGMMRKISGRNLYQISVSGRTLLATFLLAGQASADQLMK